MFPAPEAEGMRTYAVLALAVAGTLLAGLAVGPLAPSSRAEPPPKLYWTLSATTVGTGAAAVQRFTPLDADGATRIVVPKAGTILNITIVFEDTMEHTFTITSTQTGAPSPTLVSIDFPSSTPKGTQRYVEMTVWAADKAQVGTRNESVETKNGGIRFFCVPHQGLGMEGVILIGGVQKQAGEAPQMGVFLRAYWIGLLGIAGTLLLVVISYFVIKSSSPKYTDHHEHIRRGGP